MSYRNIEKIIKPTDFHWVGNGFYTSTLNSFDRTKRRLDPFFLLDYNPKVEFKGTDTLKGVGSHPHKGFETVTLAYEGKIAHADSKGNKGVIEKGGVQWMTAASGILHEEFHEEEFSKKGGLFQMVQLWVNLPARFKGEKPKYQDIDNNKITKVHLPNNTGKVEIIAGEFDGQKGPAFTYTPINLFNVYLNQGGKTNFSFKNSFNTALLVINGRLKVNETEILETDSFALFENNKGENISIEALEAETIVLILSGEPLNEPIAHYGPFLMNTTEELEIAFKEFQEGKFGNL